VRQINIPLDTGDQVAAMLVQHWRSSPMTQRADMIKRLCTDVELLARSQISAERPRLGEPGVCHELARRRYGAALADAAFAGRQLGG